MKKSLRDYMRLQHFKKMISLTKGWLTLGLVVCLGAMLAACSPHKPTMHPLTKQQKREIALGMLEDQHAAVIHRGNQIDILIPTALLFQTYSTNMQPNAARLLSPLYHAIKTYDVQTVSIQGINLLNPTHDESLLTRARAGIVGQHLWHDGLSNDVPLVYGRLRAKDLSDSNLTKDLHAPLIWIHWRYLKTPRMYD
jgi:hypothetical protein